MPLFILGHEFVQSRIELIKGLVLFYLHTVDPGYELTDIIRYAGKLCRITRICFFSPCFVLFQFLF